MSSGKSVWVLAEQSQGRLSEVSLEVLSCGRPLADSLGATVSAVVAGSQEPKLAEALASYGADKVYLLNSPLNLEYHAGFYVEAISGLFEEEKPEIVLFGATLAGREIAPRLAARLGAGLISECVSLSLDEKGRLRGTRLTHGGRLSSTIVCSGARPPMATVKPGIMKVARPDAARRAEVAVITPELDPDKLRTRMLGVARADPDKISLDEAEVIVAGGKGVGSRENLRLLEEIARCLGGVVAGSLGAVDEGWLPRRKLVGQTGTTVAPRLYLACGISGSVYHVLGMRDSEFVLAINKDPGAPIFKVADMGIIGDVVEVASAILERLRETGRGEAR